MGSPRRVRTTAPPEVARRRRRTSRCTACIERNCERLGFAERSNVVQALAEDVLEQPSRLGGTQRFQLVTMAPPYEEIDYPELMRVLVSRGRKTA